MDKKIIIGLILAIVIAGSAAAYVAFDMMNYEKKTVEIFENGTSIVVPATLELTNRTEDAVTFEDKENTTHIAGFRYDDSDNFLNVNGIIESMIDEYIHNATDKAELQDNGVFKLSGEQRKKIAAQRGTNTKDKKEVNDLYIGILKNESLNQTIIITSENEQYVVDMMDSVVWKKSPKESVEAETVTSNNTTKTTKPVEKEEKDVETDDEATVSGVSAENNKSDFSDYEVDDSDYVDDTSYDDEYPDDEVTYGDEEFHSDQL